MHRFKLLYVDLRTGEAVWQWKCPVCQVSNETRVFVLRGDWCPTTPEEVTCTSCSTSWCAP